MAEPCIRSDITFSIECWLLRMLKLYLREICILKYRRIENDIVVKLQPITEYIMNIYSSHIHSYEDHTCNEIFQVTMSVNDINLVRRTLDKLLLSMGSFNPSDPSRLELLFNLFDKLR